MVTVSSVIIKTATVESIFPKTGSTWVSVGASSSTNTYGIWVVKPSTF
jgi:hypothetical protein